MPLSNLVIVGIMRRGDLDGTSSEFHVDDDGVCDDGKTTGRNERVFEEFAVKVLKKLDGELFFVSFIMRKKRTDSVSRIVRVNGDGGITEHCLGTGCGNNESLV